MSKKPFPFAGKESKREEAAEKKMGGKKPAGKMPMPMQGKAKKKC